ncbi:protein kinase domain-containing protein [Anoxynatronum buryatiense]|uniref:Serine/threonine protein kinase n=1 Tax=Anoxynatronum buryatiense TaxID=489973 RepID=A0AA46AK13_9CLOT|nr:protein kinase [Anoxynatronum buryatiense]SMP65251.1 Serine/threonine protein kinase [Anoxynatronum buryatiense]
MENTAYCMGCMAQGGSEAHCAICGWLAGSPASSALHLPPGTLLHGKYLVGRALGQGGFGITYIARDLYLDRVLAIKEYFPRELVTRDQDGCSVALYHQQQMEQYQYGMEKFLEEGRTLAKFEGHPNIVSVQDFFESHQTAYLVMPYIEGVALSDYLKSRQSVLAFDEALQIMMPVMDALSTVHEAGMLHRDISPDNIYISRHGRVMILDFGAARHAMNQQNRQYSIILKPGYAPPEQYRQKGNQGPWTDVYAVAATFFQAITGTMPPDALERMEADTLRWPDWISDQLPETRLLAIETALAPRPEDRYQSVTAFQNALFQGASRAAVPVQPAAEPQQPQHPSHPPQSQGTRADPNPWEVSAMRHHRQPTGSESVDVLANRPVMAQPHGQESVVTTLTVGRAMDNDIVIRDDTVSRYHARLVCENRQWTLIDLESTHGTYLNGVRVTQPVVINPGSYLQFSQASVYFDGNYLLSERGEIIRTLWHSRDSSHEPNLQSAEAFWSQPSSVGISGASGNSGAVGNPGVAGGPGGDFGAGQSPSRGWMIGVAAVVALALVAAGIFFVLGGGASRHQSTPQAPGAQTPPQLTTGTISYDGGEYAGQLMEGKPHGEGTWTQDRSSSTGAFGQLSASGQRTYEGQWENGMKHGSGVMRHPDGSVQRGRWEQDIYMGRE